MRGSLLRWSLIAGALLALTLGPFLLFEERMARYSEGLLHDPSGSPAVAAAVVLLLASDLLAPVPSSFVATAAGLSLGLLPGTAAVWLGLQLGALAGYGAGRLASGGAAVRILGEAELRRATDAYGRWGGLFLIAARAVPVLAEGSVVVAGLLRMPLLRFSVLVGLSNLAIAAVYAGLGAYARDVSTFLLAIAASILIPGSLILLQRALAARGARDSAAARWGRTV